jgi:hypothetical protein
MNTSNWIFIGCVTAVMATSVCAARDIYVSADAASGGDGGQRTPFHTLTEARDFIRNRPNSNDAVTVHIGSGVYRLDGTFELTAEDGGSAEGPVTWRAEQFGQARIHGGITLSANAFQPVADESVRSRLDESVRDQVRVFDLSSAVPGEFEGFRTAFRGAPVGPWLYVDGQRMTLARWPNADADESGWASFSRAIDTGLPEPESADAARHKTRPGAFEFDDPRPAHWNLDEGVWLQGYWTHDWSDEVIRVAAYDPQRRAIALAAPHHYGIKGKTWGAAKRRFFALNALEELDAPGEWYLDRKRKRLYYYPGGEPQDASIVLATLNQPLLKITGARHLTIEGLAFEYGHSDGIVLQETQHVQIVGCVIANLAGGGVSVSGSHNIVQSCDLYNLGTKGISLNGGDRRSLTLAGNQAVNNHIHHYALFQRTYAPGIGVGGCGQIVRHNCIHDAPHNAVLYGGNEHLFELNEVYRVVMETGDAGAFYTGRDWTSQGNVLRHNYIHDLGGGEASHVNTMGVYLDDCDCGDTVQGNVFYRAGRAIMIGGGRDNPVLNNLVIDCPIGLHIDARGMTWPQWNNPNEAGWQLDAKARAMNYRNPPWSERYPHLAAIMDDFPREPLYNPIRRNVFVDCTKQVCSFDSNVKKLIDKLEIADNLVVSTTGADEIATAGELNGFALITGTPTEPVQLGFTDVTTHNFLLQQDSRLGQELPTFEDIPFDRIGLMKDNVRRKLPVRE